MLPLEAIAVLGMLYVFFMVGTLRARRARQPRSREAKIGSGVSAAAIGLALKGDQGIGRDG
jgi:hypothetical protein